MKVIGVNGIRSKGTNNTDKMLADLDARGWETYDFNYPKVWAFQARSRRRQRRIALDLVEQHNHGDAVIAHSYGALITLRAMEMGAQFSQVFFFGAAMNDDFTFPFIGMLSLDNIHNLEDKALMLGSLLRWHDFGPMGQTGYSGPPDPRITNTIDFSAHQRSLRHSHYFLSSNRERWVAFINARLRSHGHPA